MKLDVLSSAPHYDAHLLPIYDALPKRLRGDFMRTPHRTERPVLVAAYGDLVLARKITAHTVIMEHGAGQSYGGAKSRLFGSSPSFIGGRDRLADLTLVPHEMGAARSRAAYPDMPVEVIGNPRLSRLSRGPQDGGKVLAVSFHWPGKFVPEMEWAFVAYRQAIFNLARFYTILGHGHPRVFDQLTRWYKRAHIEPVKSFDEVCERANLYMIDNSSTLFEFAATDRPVVVLNTARFRRNVEHGLRFWQYANVGVNCDQPTQLRLAVEKALADPPEVREARHAAIDAIYPYRDAKQAVKVLTKYLSGFAPERQGTTQADVSPENDAIHTRRVRKPSPTFLDAPA